MQPAVASVGDFHRCAKMQLPAPWTRLRVVFDDETEPVALVAIGMQVATHRFGGALDGVGADDVGIDDAVVQRRIVDVDAVVRGLIAA